MTHSSADTPVLSIVMPVYNEAKTLEAVVGQVRAVPLAHQLVIVDDASVDGTREVLDRLASLPGVDIISHPANRGKGAALRTGFAHARGKVVIVQDADLEYDPADIPRLAEPILQGEADVVYGSRFLPAPENDQARGTRDMARANYLGNRALTWLFNRRYRQRLTDVETCYKALRLDILRQIEPRLTEDRFGIEIELSARIVQLPGVRIVERPVRYRPRTHLEGKKITWKDGVSAVRCVWRYRNS